MNIIQQKDKAKPKSILDLPADELAKLCQDPAILLKALNLARQQGFKLANERCHRFYRMMLTGQDETAIKN